MSELGDLLELLHAARARYRTVRGVLRHRSNVRISQQAHERWEHELREAGDSVGTSYAMVVGEGPPWSGRTTMRSWSGSGATRRIACARRRKTLAPERHEHVTVRDGGRWWTYSPDWGAVSNVGAGEEAERMSAGGGELWAPLLNPSVWIPALDFEVRGEAEAIGRQTLRVLAMGRELYGGDPFLFRTQLAVGADEYQLWVDRERGVVLRAAALLDGEEFWISEFEELAFDEQLPPETFVFEPPPGEEIRGPDMGMHEDVTIEEAARRASFPVFYVPELPEGRWDLDVMYVPARERPPMKESVHLAYHRVDATHHLTVAERPAEEREPDWVADGPPGVQVEVIERDGVSFTVYRPERRHGIPLTVVFDRDETAIQLSSTNLGEEILLKLAASMERLE
jgi:hypothetical protein